MANRIRQVANTPKKGMERHDLYDAAITRYNQAIGAHYYLEAITIMESLIADRLESYLIRTTTDKQYAFKTLEKLIAGLRASNDVAMPISDIEIWKNARNKALHEMAKIEIDKYEDFQTKYDKTKSCAEDGMLLFRKIDEVCQM